MIPMALPDPYGSSDDVAAPSDEFQQGGDAVVQRKLTDDGEVPPTEHASKAQSIRDAADMRDLDALIDLASSEAGLLNDQLRNLAWPILLGIDRVTQGSVSAAGERKPATPFTELAPYHDEEQVEKDVNRSFVHYPRTRSDKELQSWREQLSSLILAVLRRHPYLHYFQGYHDIVQVFLLVLGPEAAVPAVESVSLLRIRDFMLPSIAASVTHLNLIPAILYSADHELYTHLKSTDPFYALSATLTLYAHNIEAYSDIARLFDFLLANDATTPIYFFVATILIRREKLLEIDPEFESDILAYTVQKLPTPLDLEGLVRQTIELKSRYSPEKLPFRAWKKVSRYSVLKTTRDADRLRNMTLAEGKELFDLQAKEMYWQQKASGLVKQVHSTLRKNRKPATLVVLTVAMGVLAVWLAGDEQRLGSTTTLAGGMFGGLRRWLTRLG